jgi:hypothetical protein
MSMEHHLGISRGYRGRARRDDSMGAVVNVTVLRVCRTSTFMYRPYLVGDGQTSHWVSIVFERCRSRHRFDRAAMGSFNDLDLPV